MKLQEAMGVFLLFVLTLLAGGSLITTIVLAFGEPVPWLNVIEAGIVSILSFIGAYALYDHLMKNCHYDEGLAWYHRHRQRH